MHLLSSSRTLLVAIAAALALVSCMPPVDAYAKYIKLLPNGGDVPDAPAVGHPDAAGMEGVNDFGKAFKKAGNAWTKTLCMADSDGDGFTNGQEMGDPCCTWTPTSTAGLITDGISHPSDKTKTPTNAKLIAGCAATSGATTAKTTTAPAVGTSDGGGAASPAANSTTGGVNDVLAPVSATAAPKANGGSNTNNAMPADDDEDDSSESAVITTTASSALSAVQSSYVASAAACVAVTLALAAV